SALRTIAYPRPEQNLADAAHDRYGIDPLLLESTLHDASQFDAWADNPASGARGIARLSPVHADEAALGLHLVLDADDQLRAVAAEEEQVWLLADRLRRYEGRPEVALTALAT